MATSMFFVYRRETIYTVWQHEMNGGPINTKGLAFASTSLDVIHRDMKSRGLTRAPIPSVAEREPGLIELWV